MNELVIFSLLPILVVLELIYFKIATILGIVDRPNHRSSHNAVTLRGGGIIFLISLLMYPIYYGSQYIWFLIGLTMISAISFVDDIKSVSSILRIVIHFGAVLLMFYQLQILALPWYWMIISFIFVIGCINAINFMDGINGITGAYALVTLSTLLFINMYVTTFVETNFLLVSIFGVLVFNFFNFRRIARCFAGDVGSVGIAFIIVFFLLSLIIKTNNLNYILLLLVYGLDAVVTIFFRILRKENITKPHRSHFYQYLANERKIPHLIVSSLYAFIQLAINFSIIYISPKSYIALALFIIPAGLIFIIVRFVTEGREKLLN